MMVGINSHRLNVKALVIFDAWGPIVIVFLDL